MVKAYSLITDLVEKYKSSQGRRSEAGLESLESRGPSKPSWRVWRTVTLDLLVLPVVKEVLLDLVKQSGLDSHAMRAREGPVPVIGNGSWAMQRTADEIALKALEDRIRAQRTRIPATSSFPQSSHRINGTDAFNSKSYDPFSRGFTLDPTPFEIPESPEPGSPQENESETPVTPQDTSCCLRGAEKILTTLSSSSPPWDLSIMWCKPFLTELAPKKPRNFWI